MQREIQKETTIQSMTTHTMDEKCNRIASDTTDSGCSTDTDSSTTTSIDDAIDKIGTGKFQLQILFAAGTCFMADSMEVILLSFLIVVLKEEWDWGEHGSGSGNFNSDGNSNGDSADQKLANITAVMFAGSLLGTYILGPMGDRIGRRPITLIAALTISMGGLMTSMCDNYPSLLLARSIVGFGIGALTVPFDTLTEFLPTEDRGRFVTYIGYFWTAGSMLVPLVAYVTLELVGSWRVFVLVCAIPCVISVVCGYLFVPESPRWLMLKGREEEALDILRKGAALNGKDPNVVFPPGCSILEEMTADEVSDYGELCKPRWRCITILLFVVWWGFALGYYGTILIVTKVFDENQNDYYDGSDDDDGGGGGDDGIDDGVGGISSFDYSAIFISSSAEILGTLLAISLMDRIGRIPTLVISFLIGGVSLFPLCFLFGHVDRNVLVALAFLARVGEQLGGSATWICTAEIFSTEIRSTGHSATNAISKIGGFISPYLVTGGSSLKKIGITMLIVHVVTALCASRLPETKGRDLGWVSSDHDDDDGDDDEYEYDYVDLSYSLTETEPIWRRDEGRKGRRESTTIEHRYDYGLHS